MISDGGAIREGCFVRRSRGGVDIDAKLLVKRFDEHIQGACGRLWKMRRFRHDGFCGASWESGDYPVTFQLSSPTKVVCFIDGLGWCMPEATTLTFDELESKVLDALDFIEQGKPGGICGFIDMEYERAKHRRLEMERSWRND